MWHQNISMEHAGLPDLKWMTILWIKSPSWFYFRPLWSGSPAKSIEKHIWQIGKKKILLAASWKPSSANPSTLDILSNAKVEKIPRVYETELKVCRHLRTGIANLMYCLTSATSLTIELFLTTILWNFWNALWNMIGRIVHFRKETLNKTFLPNWIQQSTTTRLQRLTQLRFNQMHVYTSIELIFSDLG